MTKRPSAGVTAFAATGAFLLSWHLAPGPGSDPMRWVLAGAFALAGLVLAIQSIRGAERRPSPWPGWVGRIVWYLRPRSWMLAWLALVAAAHVWGTPHLLIQYPPRTPQGACDYAGLWGIVRAPATGGDFNGCRLGALIRSTTHPR